MARVVSGTVTAIVSGLLGESWAAFGTETDASKGFAVGDLIRVERVRELGVSARPDFVFASIRYGAAECSYRKNLATVASHACAEQSMVEHAIRFIVSPTVAHSLQSDPGETIRVSSLPFKLEQARVAISATEQGEALSLPRLMAQLRDCSVQLDVAQSIEIEPCGRCLAQQQQQPPPPPPPFSACCAAKRRLITWPWHSTSIQRSTMRSDK
jgi:hypothetical protein